MDTGNVREWSVDDVANWLRQEKFASYAANFLRYRIDGIALCDLQKDRFDTLTRSSMGRDDRASMLWKNINIIKRAKSRNANSNVNKNNRKPPPQNLGPPEPPQRDYRTDTEDDNIDCFTDDEEEVESDNGEYLDPTEDIPRGPPQVPSRPTDLNASWGQPARANPLTELQKGLMRRMSERAVSKIPRTPVSQDQKRNTMPAYDTEHDSDLYLAPAGSFISYLFNCWN
ncbi:uncharacterized protein LOC575645 isoform X5 [Strongylocentrotus purpuratus]|uniref:SAM domain-containing protein n=1 Tax=Strongylocentrotus purpuratus TaxID=7668 RepID=A0A7M7NT73_STRPU|nr:uncharacterized protein LOC575645 isoform X5 [Strongylocentrotus purpuratus]